MDTTAGTATPLEEGVKGLLREGKVDEALLTCDLLLQADARNAFAHGVKGQILQRNCVWHDLLQGRPKRPGRAVDIPLSFGNTAIKPGTKRVPRFRWIPSGPSAVPCAYQLCA